MAYAKKTTTNSTRKTAAKAVVEESVKVETAVEAEPVIEKEPEPVKVPEKKKFHADDMILCRSVTVGKLIMEGATSNMVYRWMNYGDEAEVEYRDLVSAVRAHSQFVYAPYFIVEDEDFVKEFLELDKFYREKFTVKELSDIILMNEGEMEDAISVLPKGAKEQFVNIVSTQVSDGTLDSVRKIKVLERILGIDLSLVAEMK